MSMQRNGHQSVRFLFDPACPWAYRASLWIREVAEMLPLLVNWELFSLEYVNRERLDDLSLERLAKNRHAIRLLACAKEIEGNAGIDALYSELGQAVFEHQESLGDEAVLAHALTKVGLPLKLLAETREDTELDVQLDSSYAAAVTAKVFGVPTLFLNESQKPFYGPLISSVPTGYEAAKLWEHVSGLASLPYFFELKSLH